MYIWNLFLLFVSFLSNQSFSVLAKLNFNLDKETKQKLSASFSLPYTVVLFISYPPRFLCI